MCMCIKIIPVMRALSTNSIHHNQDYINFCLNNAPIMSSNLFCMLHVDFNQKYSHVIKITLEAHQGTYRYVFKMFINIKIVKASAIYEVHCCNVV